MNDTEDKTIERIDFLRDIDKALESFRKQNQKLLESLTPRERAILEKRFKDKKERE